MNPKLMTTEQLYHTVNQAMNTLAGEVGDALEKQTNVLISELTTTRAVLFSLMACLTQEKLISAEALELSHARYAKAMEIQYVLDFLRELGGATEEDTQTGHATDANVSSIHEPFSRETEESRYQQWR